MATNHNTPFLIFCDIFLVVINLQLIRAWQDKDQIIHLNQLRLILDRKGPSLVALVVQWPV